jgi:hypothetical protein
MTLVAHLRLVWMPVRPARLSMRPSSTYSGVCRSVCAFALTATVLPTIATAGPVSAGNGFTVVAMPDQSVAVWGANGSGQLGLGDTQPRAVPTACV